MSVLLNNIDDFIVPSQACINPLIEKKPEDIKVQSSSTKKLTLTVDATQSDFEIENKLMKPNLIQLKNSSSSTKKVASISLNDCLACSGCITSAEAVLINQQSFSKLLESLALSDNVIVIAISPQSLSSIADLLDISSADIFLILANILKSIGVKYVIDSTSTVDLALMETRQEFLDRLKHNSHQAWKDPEQKTTAVSSTQFNIINSVDHIEKINCGYVEQSPRTLPMFVSSCPGWICYVEKTYPQLIPFLSTTKSPQQILGILVKKLFRNKIIETITSSPSPSLSIIHNKQDHMKEKGVMLVSIQPCFDKKLEASRLDFYHEDIQASEIDLVLSTTEFWNLLEHLYQNHEKFFPSLESNGMNTDVASFIRSFPLDDVHGRDDFEKMFRCFSEDGLHLMHSIENNAGSGGYLEDISHYLLSFHPSRQTDQSYNEENIEKLSYKTGRNQDIAGIEIDITEYDLNPDKLNRGDLVISSENLNLKYSKIKCGKLYGFRNIQMALIKLKQQKLDLDFIEVMACPSGCINGGGQIKVNNRESAIESKERIRRINEVFHSRKVRKFDENLLVQSLYYDNLSKLSYDERQKLFHTRYHAIPKLEDLAPMIAKW